MKGLARLDRTLTRLGGDRLQDPRSSTGPSNTALGLQQAALFLVHWPLPTVRDYTAVSQAMEVALGHGLARSIWVLNFQREHLQRLLDETEIVPTVKQIEAHPYLTQDALRASGESHGIATEAWSPHRPGGCAARPGDHRIAGRLDRSGAQLTLRWHILLGSIVFPKSVTSAHRRQLRALRFRSPR